MHCTQTRTHTQCCKVHMHTCMEICRKRVTGIFDCCEDLVLPGQSILRCRCHCPLPACVAPLSLSLPLPLLCPCSQSNVFDIMSSRKTYKSCGCNGRITHTHTAHTLANSRHVLLLLLFSGSMCVCVCLYFCGWLSLFQSQLEIAFRRCVCFHFLLLLLFLLLVSSSARRL